MEYQQLICFKRHGSTKGYGELIEDLFIINHKKTTYQTYTLVLILPRVLEMAGRIPVERMYEEAVIVSFKAVLNSRWGLGIFLFTTASRTALGPTQPPIQWVPGALSLGVKRLWCEADHSPPSSAEVKE
jgi:hypothetical protein